MLYEKKVASGNSLKPALPILSLRNPDHISKTGDVTDNSTDGEFTGTSDSSPCAGKGIVNKRVAADALISACL
jgi:hypothetical protein